MHHLEVAEEKSSKPPDGQPAPRGRSEGFPAGSVFDPSKFSRNAGESDGEEFNSPRHGGRERGRRIRSRSRTPIHSILKQHQQEQSQGEEFP